MGGAGGLETTTLDLSGLSIAPGNELRTSLCPSPRTAPPACEAATSGAARAPRRRRRPPSLSVPAQPQVNGSLGSARGVDAKRADSSEGAGGHWWCVCRQGRLRARNEDCYRVQAERGLFAVFDGHGDGRASRHASEHLLQHVARLSDGVHGRSDMADLFRRAFAATEEDLRAIDSSARQKCVGTTALAVMLTDDTLVVAHVGDSRAVMSTAGGVALELSLDHSTRRSDEVQRIEQSGAMIVDNRVNGVLNVTRAIGDFPLKPAVSCEPDTVEVDLRARGGDFVILASDGLWNFVGNQHAVNIVRAHDGDLQKAAEALADEAVRCGSMDDISALVLRLDCRR